MLSNEELAKLGEHMRQRLECEGQFATYALLVDVDGSRIHESIVRGAGLRNDRPIYLLEDFNVSAGHRRVHVSFARRARAAIPPRLELDTALTFSPGHVIVVTLDPELGALQVLAAAPPSK
jgi:hypothetical protein